MCQEDGEQQGMVFNIQKYSVHDGPGIRTIVFLKGCALSCRWCSNPESQNARPELAYNAGRCLTLAKCTRCLESCPRKALTCGEDGGPRIDRSLWRGLRHAVRRSLSCTGPFGLRQKTKR